MSKKHIKAWGLGKNYKAAEKADIARMMADGQDFQKLTIRGACPLRLIVSNVTNARHGAIACRRLLLIAMSKSRAKDGLHILGSVTLTQVMKIF